MKNSQQRSKILQALYEAREAKPKSGWLSNRDLTDAVGECEFSLGVLTELNHIKKDDFKYRITGQGILQSEQNERPPNNAK